MKKSIIIFLVLAFSGIGHAYIYERENSTCQDEIISYFEGVEKGELRFRINGADCNVALYESPKDPGDIIGYFLDKHKADDKVVLPVETLSSIGQVMMRSCGADVLAPDYCCFRNTKGNNVIVYCGEKNRGAVVVVIETGAKENKSRYFDDGITHPVEIEKLSSIEILNGDKTIHFQNMYNTYAMSEKEAAALYIRSLNKDGWKTSVISENCFEAQKGKNSRMVSFIADSENKILISIMG